MKHIVIDAREIRTSTGRYVERLLHYLQDIDTAHRYTVLLKPKDIDGWRPTNPNFSKLVCPYKEFSFAEQIGMKKQLDALRPDLVYFPMAQQPMFYKGRVVTTIQDLTTIRFRNPTKNWFVYTVKQQVYKVLVKRVAKKSLHIITSTEFVKQDVMQYAGVPASKISVAPLAADDFSEPATPIKAFVGKRYIMYNGRPLPHKNLRRLIEAFALIHKKQPDLYLMIAGKKDASHASYMQLAEQLGVSTNVIQTDWITDGELKWAMQNTEAYVFPSLSEGFGLPPLEAMLQGAPVVASNATCVPEVCRDAAHYFNPHDVQDIARAISEVLADKNLQAELVKKGSQQVKKYSWKRMAEQTLAVYEKALKS